MPFVQITAAQTDADSPLDQALMDTVRLNFDDHEARLLTFTPADGTVATPKIVDANVTLAKLKMAAGSWSGTLGNGESISIAINRYSHLNQSFTDSPSSPIKLGLAASASWFTGVSVFNPEVFNQTGGLSWDYHTN